MPPLTAPIAPNAAGTTPGGAGAPNPGGSPNVATKPGIPPENGKPGTPGAKPGAGTDPLKAATDAAVKKYKLVVDGKEEEVDEPELIKRAQKGTAAEKRFQEAHMTRQEMGNLKAQVERLMGVLRDPEAVWETLQKLGHEPRGLAEKFLTGIIKEEQLTPEQKKVRDAERILSENETRKKNEERTAHEKRQAELEERFTNEFSQQVTKALTENQLPKTPWTVKMMAYYMAQGLKHNANLTASDVVPLVKKHFVSQINEILGATDGDILIGLLGETVLGKVRKADLERLKDPKNRIPANQQPKGGEIPAGAPAKPKLTMDEFREQNERIKNG